MKISLKTRLTLIVSAIVILTLLGQGILLIHNWKQAIRSEVDSSYSLAKRLVGSSLISPASTLNELQKDEIVGVLEGMRHIQVMVNYSNKPNVENSNNSDDAGTSAPDWFKQLIYPYDEALPKVDIHSFVNDSILTIQADANDEIEEVWEDFKIQSMITIGFSVFIIALMYTGLHFGLIPLKQLHDGFEKLQQGDFNVNVSEDVSQELSFINQKFNHMVTVLRETSQDNSLLVKKLVTIQEEERRAISREIHDEMGPRLFAIRVNLSKVKSQIDSGEVQQASQQLDTIDNSVIDLQAHMRKLLKELRPLILDDLSIKDAVNSIFESSEIGTMGVDWNVNLGGLDEELEDTLKVTLYRIIQECVTNIIRHSKATSASVVVFTAEKLDSANNPITMLIVDVEDNGVGIQNQNIDRFGLIGMKERVRALGGILKIHSGTSGGVRVTAEIPLHPLDS